MKKILFVGQSLDKTQKLMLEHMKFFKRNDYSVDFLGNVDAAPVVEISAIKEYDFGFPNGLHRAISHIKQLQKLILPENYTAMITYEDISGYLARMSTKGFLKKNTDMKCIHFAIEYPFYDNPLGQEERKSLSRQRRAGKFTDLLIVMNNTDLELAEKYELSSDTVVKLYGMGVTPIYDSVRLHDKSKLRTQYNLQNENIIAYYQNDFEPNKNHKFLISNIFPIITRFPQFKLLLNGSGSLYDELRNLAVIEKIERNLIFLEKNTNLDELMALSDIVISSSYIEGIPTQIINALECHIPILASAVKGTKDVVDDGINAILYGTDNTTDFVASLYLLLEKPEVRKHMSLAKNLTVSDYFTENAHKHIFNYYRKILVP